MAAITGYPTLAAAVADWAERSDYDIDEVIGLAEAEFRLHFGPSYAKETTATLTFAAGLATLPTGYVRAVSLTHPTGGPLTQVSWDALNTYNPMGISGIPVLYALSGSNVKTAPLFDGDATFTYEGTLAGLSAENPTNWLISTAPQAYLSMCLHLVKAKAEDPSAPAYKASSLQTLADLGIQANAARYGHAAMTIRGPTP